MSTQFLCRKTDPHEIEQKSPQRNVKRISNIQVPLRNRGSHNRLIHFQWINIPKIWGIDSFESTLLSIRLLEWIRGDGRTLLFSRESYFKNRVYRGNYRDVFGDLEETGEVNKCCSRNDHFKYFYW